MTLSKYELDKLQKKHLKRMSRRGRRKRFAITISPKRAKADRDYLDYVIELNTANYKRNGRVAKKVLKNQI